MCRWLAWKACNKYTMFCGDDGNFFKLRSCCCTLCFLLFRVTCYLLNSRLPLHCPFCCDCDCCGCWFAVAAPIVAIDSISMLSLAPSLLKMFMMGSFVPSEPVVMREASKWLELFMEDGRCLATDVFARYTAT